MVTVRVFIVSFCFKNVGASKTLEHCACAGLTKAVRKLSDSTKQLCDDNSKLRSGKIFEFPHWHENLNLIHGLFGPKVTSF